MSSINKNEVSKIVHMPIKVKDEPREHNLWKFHSCRLCPYKTKSFFIMKSHIRRHRIARFSKIFNCARSSPEKFKCGNCDYKTPLVVNFYKHFELAHRLPVRVKTEDGQLLVQSNKCVDLLRSYTCQNCLYKTYSFLVYTAHCRECTIDKTNEKDVEQSTKYNQRFLKQDHLNQHTASVNNWWFECDKCTYKAKRQTTLDGHMKVKHNANDLWFVKDNQHKCSLCPFESKAEISLRYHYTSKHLAPEDVVWYYCPQCPYKSKWPFNLKKHELGHSSPVRLQCELCLYKTQQPGRLNKHMLVKHPSTVNTAFEKKRESLITTKKRKYERCEKCSFRARAGIGIKNHMLFKHTSPEDIVWHQCGLCAYKTKSAKYLKQHLAQEHKAADLFKCELCPYKTKNRSDLENHILERHIVSENVVCYKCELCTFKTIQQTELKEHILDKHIVIDDVDWWQCELCAYRSKQRFDLKKHVLLKHIL